MTCINPMSDEDLAELRMLLECEQGKCKYPYEVVGAPRVVDAVHARRHLNASASSYLLPLLARLDSVERMV